MTGRNCAWRFAPRAASEQRFAPRGPWEQDLFYHVVDKKVMGRDENLTAHSWKK